MNDFPNSDKTDVQYKVLFLGRHGEGVHNVAERRYGTQAWDDYWSLLDGDEYGSWVDARLTEVGISQAKTAHDAWAKQIKQNIPSPQSYYVSPLNRCCQTAQVTFEGLDMPLTSPFRPVIKELLRETMGVHTCDSRSKASAIAAEFPEYQFEPGFSEDDLLYDTKTRESDEDRNRRLQTLLNDIFGNDKNIFLSLTAHSGAITSILEVVGHRKFPLQTGAVIPVLVRAEKKQSSSASKSEVGPQIKAFVEKARRDVEFKRLMEAVGSDRASTEERAAFQKHVDDAADKDA
ncbi:uncharacterized protein N7443_010537 [Penicillium atrosanguineum]|uniref:Phosphoglycerate mutase-like protein n=1 Tax=Penicillium atrosanguineum TaxID=1132637 RepID=A0A9W9U205_9EURO|nr:uncharacterized protein N7443_010537 [Penicillium atrosanguineum]KAJ5290284.1 hypothetical protein N7443_010537 [Penicillium atrosanguineum]KAJ5308107.1 hypothetical protein N7476_008763 [Penicillium atrosanguineum]